MNEILIEIIFIIDKGHYNSSMSNVFFSVNCLAFFKKE